jgi:SAM-dependent methyltransferase
VWGIDVHDRGDRVAAVLARRGLQAKLVTAPAESLPFPDGYFDRMVAVSSLEFVDDIDACCNEFARVLSPTGCLVVVTPGTSPILDAGLHLLTGRKADHDFEGRRERVIPALTRHLELDKQRSFPPFIPGFRLYTTLRLRRKPGVVPPGSGRARTVPTPVEPPKFA